MSPFDESQSPGIGATLKDARRRLGMDIKEAEERTKIRTRYLRALEAEEWDVLPAPAYVRGFLRTYGEILGLDGEVLADRYRRSYEQQAAAAPPAAEPVLRNNRRGSGSRPPSRSGLIVIVGAAVVVLLAILAVIGLTSGDDEPGESAKRDRGGQARAEQKASDGGNEKDQPALEPVDLTVEPLSTVQICLVGDERATLIDSQVFSSGAEETFEGEKSYRLDLAGGGTVRLQVGDEEQRIEASGDASYEADSRGISEIEYAGPDCP